MNRTTVNPSPLSLALCIVLCSAAAAVSSGCASGGLTNADKGRIEAATKKAEPKYLECYSEALSVTPELSGKVVLAFDVKPNTTAVTNARIASSDVQSEGFQACVLKATSEMALASLPGGPGAITFPIEFSREPADPSPSSASDPATSSSSSPP